MSSRYRCRDLVRRNDVRDAVGTDGEPLWNGIDYLEVAKPNPDHPDAWRLDVHFLHELPATDEEGPGGTTALGLDNVIIEGGERIPMCHVSAAATSGKVLTVYVDTPVDLSWYTLRIVVSSSDRVPPAGFDPPLSEVVFSFSVDCASDFDCLPSQARSAEPLPVPQIDYLAKDYASFRRLMLERLSLLMPAWNETSPADSLVTLVETLAYVADHLSYYQDAVATEAYLGTARSRISVRRHVRLLDYPMHDGCNARAWVCFELAELAPPLDVPVHSRLLTGPEPSPPAIPDTAFKDAVREGALVFETMHPVTLRRDRNEIPFYTWGEETCCLPQGATGASLRNVEGALSGLAPGDLLLLEERYDPSVDALSPPDPAHRHVVRLTKVDFVQDELYPDASNPDQPTQVVNVEWDPADALPFSLCLRQVRDKDGRLLDACIARGNLVLVDHGSSTKWSTETSATREAVDDRGRFHPDLDGPITQQGMVPSRAGDDEEDFVPLNGTAPASSAFLWDMVDVRPAVEFAVGTSDERWKPQRDLLDSGPFSPDFVLETENDGTPRIRFGDNVMGRRPTAGEPVQVDYRVGNGPIGNVGAESITTLVTDEDTVSAKVVTKVRNPLPAKGGEDPEPLDRIRWAAPQAFRVQQRAVTEADYQEVLERRADVQRARANLRWTGSWYTSFVAIDRVGGVELGQDFREELHRYLDVFRMAGCDLEFEPPRFVPLDIAFTVCVAPGFYRADVEAALTETFSTRDLPDGRRGFFHPDNFTFGQPVYLSRVVAAAMAVPGVLWVDAEVLLGEKLNRFQRWGPPDREEFLAGQISMGRLEIARLDNDLSAPENGRIRFFMEGGV